MSNNLPHDRSRGNRAPLSSRGYLAAFSQQRLFGSRFVEKRNWNCAVRRISIVDAAANGSFCRDKTNGTGPLSFLQMEVASFVAMPSCLTICLGFVLGTRHAAFTEQFYARSFPWLKLQPHESRSFPSSFIFHWKMFRYFPLLQLFCALGAHWIARGTSTCFAMLSNCGCNHDIKNSSTIFVRQLIQPEFADDTNVFSRLSNVLRKEFYRIMSVRFRRKLCELWARKI